MPEGNCEGDTHLEPLSNSARGSDKHTKHLIKETKRGDDGSLAWFDSLEESNRDDEDTFQKNSPVPKLFPERMASKTLCRASCSAERSVSVPRRGNEVAESPATVNLCASVEQNKVSKGRRKRPEEHNSSSEANTEDPASPSASLQGSVVTQRVSKRCQRLRTDKSRAFLTSTQDPEAALLSASDLPDLSSDADSLLGVEESSVSVAAKPAAVSTRKRSKGQVVKETKVLRSHDPEVLDSESPPAAKLAKFSFTPRTKLDLSSEKKNEEFSLFHSETTSKSGEQLQGEQLPEECCPPEKCKMTLTHLGKNSLEKQSMENREKQQSEALGKEIRGSTTIHSADSSDAMSSLPTEKKKEGEEKLGGPRPGKVCSSTLATLSTFSFASRPESKSETSPAIRIDTNKGSHSPLLKVHVSNPSRRKSFALGNVSKASAVTQKSLFSIAELDDAALDFDWDEEVRKNPST